MYVVGYFVLFKGIKNPEIKKINVKEYINNISQKTTNLPRTFHRDFQDFVVGDCNVEES